MGGVIVAQTRIVLGNCEIIDPSDIRTYLTRDGFKALEKARKEMTPDSVIEEVKNSGLRGRGGAGFPCGVKWELARKGEGTERFLICNADEGEMGTFKDRYILQYDPFSLIEGIGIAAYAIGAQKAFIYLRAEYRYLLHGIRGAIEEAKTRGFIRDIEIEIREGAGAYVCGEESALMNSIEGKRGEARFRPPFPPVSGLFGKPTIINNVETLANLPRVILKGASWFGKIGTEKSKGTKVFSVSGDVERPGVYELEMGSRLRELVVDLAGAEDIRIIQVGGATGRILPANKLDSPLAFETVLGSGAVTVYNSSRDLLEVIYHTIKFLAEESCGKCAPCREGTEVMVEIFERMTKGEGLREDVDALRELSKLMMSSSLCGLGQGTPVPVLDSLEYFREDYENRISQSLYIRSLKGREIA